MKKFFNLTFFMPLFISLSAVSPNSCQKNEKFDVNLKDLTDTAIVKDYRLKYTDGSNFYFDNNKNSRYFIMTREALCFPEFSGEGQSLWKYGVNVYVYVFDDSIWDKVASMYHFNRSTNKEDIKTKMSGSMFYFRITCALNTNVSASKCILTNIEKLPAWNPEKI
ncbi:MAG: hypothetical protein ACRC8P_03190 [Spiroplasma sp.]